MTRVVGYEPRYDIDFAKGLIGENLVAGLPEAIQSGTVEVKTDYRAVDTGNFYVETWQYGKSDESDKRLSGINTTGADFWAFVIPQTNCIYVINTNNLKALVIQNRYKETRQRIINKHTNASIGRLVPVAHIASQMLVIINKCLNCQAVYKAEDFVTCPNCGVKPKGQSK